MDDGIDCLSIWPFMCSPATTALIAMVVGSGTLLRESRSWVLGIFAAPGQFENQ